MVMFGDGMSKGSRKMEASGSKVMRKFLKLCFEALMLGFKRVPVTLRSRAPSFSSREIKGVRMDRASMSSSFRRRVRFRGFSSHSFRQYAESGKWPVKKLVMFTWFVLRESELMLMFPASSKLVLMSAFLNSEPDISAFLMLKSRFNVLVELNFNSVSSDFMIPKTACCIFKVPDK